jgi:phosphopantetheinyl transferase (holo-ACP synthase)
MLENMGSAASRAYVANTFVFKECILENWGTNHGEPQRFASVKIQPLTSLAPAAVRAIY